MTVFGVFYWILITAIVVFLLFCLVEAVINEPRLFRHRNEQHIFKKTATNLRIRANFESLEGYRPNPLIPGPWLKLLFIFKLRPKKPFNFFTRRVHQFKDGGRVAIDFFPPLVESKLKNPNLDDMGKDTPEMQGKWEVTKAPSEQSPLVIIVPGLSGTSTEGYLTSACEELWNSKLKIRSVIVNRRGYSGVELSGPHPMSWIRWEDVEDIIYWLRTVRKEKHIFIYGASLGGNYAHWHSGRTAELQNGAALRHDFGEGHLVDDYPHLLAQGYSKGSRATSLGPLASVDGFIAVSAPFDMHKCVSRLEKSRILDTVLN